MSRLSELAVAKRSVTLLLASALFVAGISAWGEPPAGAPAGHRLPDRDRRRALPGRRRRRTSPSRSPSRSNAPIGGVAAAGEPPVDVGRTRSPWWSPSSASGPNVKETVASIQENLARPACRPTSTPPVSAFNINSSPVVIASIAATSRRTGSRQRPEIARTEIVPAIQSVEGVAEADLTGGLEQQLIVTLDPAKLTAADVVEPADRPASSRPTTSPSRPASSRPTASGSRSRRSASSTRSPTSPTSSSASSCAQPVGTAPAGRRPARPPAASRRSRPQYRRRSGWPTSGRSRRSARRRPATPGRTASRP